MIFDFLSLSKRDKAVFIGLFLSKYDKLGLEKLGFSSFKQAYNVLGYSIGVIPKSIQNYRDEFDPYFPNPRKGWRNRKLRDFCYEILSKTVNWTFDDFYSIIRLCASNNIYENLNEVEKEKKFFASRLITGKAAEEYFVMNYEDIEIFKNYNLCDTTNLGCGYDFKLSCASNDFFIEVKGLNGKEGNILMTEKEFNVAEYFKEKYCLFVVSNFKENPKHNMYFNPVYNTALSFQKQERQIIQISYYAKF